MKLAIVAVVLCLIACSVGASLKERRLANVRRIYENLIYPNPLPLIIGGGTQATFFHPNVSGRINPVGPFLGRQETVEYFYALGNPVNYNITEGEYRIIQVDIRLLDLVGTRASIEVNIHLAPYPNETTQFNLTQIGWYGYLPNDDRVAFYDDTIIRLGQIMDTAESMHPAIIAGLCVRQAQRCTGPNQQFDNVTACIEFMNSIEYGSWSNAYSNTVVCRIVHNNLTPVRPEFHCPHVGPTGGGKCIDHSYESWYDNEYVVNLLPDTDPASCSEAYQSVPPHCDEPIAASCGDELCCNSINFGQTCYDDAQAQCVTNEQGEHLLCNVGEQACGTDCYDPLHYKCANAEAVLL